LKAKTFLQQGTDVAEVKAQKWIVHCYPQTI